MKIIHALLLSLLTGSIQSAQELSKPQPLILSIPGQNGQGSNPGYVTDSTGLKGTIQETKIPTTWLSIDLGQNSCIAHFDQSIQEQQVERPVSNFFIHASSQGTATALNYLAQHQKSQSKLRGIILEAVLGSGNSAICHTATNPLMGLEWLKSIPFHYYWLPYLAKLRFPFYSPSGKQAIKSVDTIKTDAPIIIVHSTDDFQLSVRDAHAIYYGLKQQNEKVYLVEKKGWEHLDIIQPGDNCLKDILSHHGLLENHHSDNPRLDTYQPNPKCYEPAYQELKAKERKHTFVARSLLLASISCVLMILKSYVSFK